MPPRDPRISVDLDHLQRLKAPAARLSFLPRQPVRSVLNGRHASRLKGRGLNFEELRHYTHGDDIRTMDWKVTARTGSPYVRVYTEERDRATLLIVDQRQSMFFGSVRNMKSVTAAEAAAIAAHCIHGQKDRVGGLVFRDDALAEHRPSGGSRDLHRLLASIARANGALSAEAQPDARVSLNDTLKRAVRLIKSGGLVMIFSDFDQWDSTTERVVAQLKGRNDVVFFPVSDPVLDTLPKDTQLAVSDGALQAQIDLGQDSTRAQLADFADARLRPMADLAAKYDIPVLPLSTAEPTLPQVLRLMGARSMRT